MPFVENLSQMFRTIPGGETVAIAGFGNVDGAYSDEHGEEFGISGTVPVFVCATADVSGVTDGTILTRGAKNFAIQNHIEDGTGVSQLVLEEQ